LTYLKILNLLLSIGKIVTIARKLSLENLTIPTNIVKKAVIKKAMKKWHSISIDTNSWDLSDEKIYIKIKKFRVVLIL